MEENKWYAKEIRRIQLAKDNLNDNYNTLDEPVDLHATQRILNANIQFGPKEGQKWLSYLEQLKIYVKFNQDRNERSHINGPKGPWYTHRSPAGCFMCEDTNLMSVMLQTMEIMVNQYPNTTF